MKGRIKKKKRTYQEANTSERGKGEKKEEGKGEDQDHTVTTDERTRRHGQVTTLLCDNINIKGQDTHTSSKGPVTNTKTETKTEDKDKDQRQNDMNKKNQKRRYKCISNTNTTDRTNIYLDTNMYTKKINGQKRIYL